MELAKGRVWAISIERRVQRDSLAHYGPPPSPNCRPTCTECMANVNFDVSIVWEDHFAMLPDTVRDTALLDYIEELTAYVLGADHAYGFWEHCFEGQRFFLTVPGSEEHGKVWDQSRGLATEREP